MNKEEFKGKVFMSYCGDRNASRDIIAEYDRLNNIIKELSKDVDMWNKKYNEQFNIITELEKWVKDYIEKYDVPDTDFICAYLRDILDKIKELKENNK